MGFQPASKTGSDVADLMSWGSSFQTEAAATTKARSMIEEHRVAGMASKIRGTPQNFCFLSVQL